MSTIELYKSYARKIGNREKIYKVVQKEFEIKSAIYPGSHIDIAPSLFISDVTYVDNFKGAIKFFKDLDVINEYINTHKYYQEEAMIRFIGEDYTRLSLERKYDLIISQYAGFVGQATKQFLKHGGYLLCNDSHGDATLAYLDVDYEFVGIVNDKYKVILEGKEKYFKLKKGKAIDKEKVVTIMKGPKYLHDNTNYLFRLK